MNINSQILSGKVDKLKKKVSLAGKRTLHKTSFICPYCFEKHALKDVEFRCTNRRCKDFDDVPLTKYENGDVNMPLQAKKVFPVQIKNPFKVPNSARCPECNSVTYKRVCPSCHNELPESTLNGTDMIISVVGSRATGKSHFVGIIIKELFERIAVRMGGSMEGFADSYSRWESGFYNRLYVNGQKLDLTQSSLQNINNGAYRPLIFKLKLKHPGLLKNSLDSYTLVFFDTAGEDLNDEDTMSTVNKYICKSSGIIFLLDPMQIPMVVNQLDKSIVERASSINISQATKADDIMTRVSHLIRKDRGLSDKAKIDIPVAAVFSKFDAIESLVPTDFIVRNPSTHCNEGYFDMSDWHNVNSEIQALLNEWEATAFTSQLETNYTDYSYFAVSSLGLDNNPSADGHIDRPRPHRIEDPLLWLLKENGVIEGR